jgi:hypothetical protein
MLDFCLGFHFKDVSLPINIFRLFQMGVKKEDPLEQDLTFIGLIGFKPSQ